MKAWTLLGFQINLANIFANNAQREHLDPTHKEDGQNNRRPAINDIAGEFSYYYINSCNNSQYANTKPQEGNKPKGNDSHGSNTFHGQCQHFTQRIFGLTRQTGRTGIEHLC